MDKIELKLFPSLKGIGKNPARFLLKSLKKDFNQTQNPLFVWRAYQLCQESGLWTPKWVLKKLHEWSINILEIDVNEKRARDSLYKALEMDIGSRSPWGKIDAVATRKDYASAYLMLSEDRKKNNLPNSSDSSIKKELANIFHVSPKTIERSINEFEDIVKSELENFDSNWTNK